MSEGEGFLARPPMWTGRCDSTFDPGSSVLASALQTCRADKREELGNRGRKKPGADRTIEADDPQTFPMSSAQLRVWLTEQVMGVSAANNLCVGLRLSGALDTAALGLGLRIVLGRHEILRTTFDLVCGRPAQRVHQESPQALTFVDLSDAPELEQAAYVVARRLAYMPFKLERGPLLRVSLLRLSPEQHILFCTLHHIIADGWSLGLFVKEVAECYTAFCERRPPALKPLPLQYADCSAWEQDWLGSAEFQRQLAQYSSRLVGAPEPPHLAGAVEAGAGPSADGASRVIRLSSELMSAMRSLAQRQATTMFALSLATFTVLLWQLSGQEDQIIGVPVAHRNRIEFEELIGPFANIVVVRTDLSGNPIFSDLLARTRRGIVETLAYEDVPFEHLVQALQPARIMGRNPIFQILFASIPTAPPMDRFGDLTIAPYAVEAAAAPFDLSVSMVQEASGAAWVRAEYRTGVFTAEQISSLLHHYVHLLHEVVADPEVPLVQLGRPPEPWMVQARSVPPPFTVASPRSAASGSPSDAMLEQMVFDIWERILHRRPPGARVNFFDLGGHSLQAVAVMHEVSHKLGRRVPVSLLFKEPTIEGMARQLRAHDYRRCAATPILRDGRLPPLFVAGSAPEIRDLSRALGPEQPFFQLNSLALQEQRLLAGEPLLTTISGIAAEFLRDILAIAPKGPYLLGGLCDGGILALEIALKLQAEGGEVALLAQFDTPVNGYYRIYWPRRLASRLVHDIGSRIPPYLRGQRQPAMSEEQRYLDHLWSATWQAVHAYRQRTLFAGELQLFRCKNRLWLSEDVARGWELRAERVRVHDVPGSHTRFLTETAAQQQIAREIQRALRHQSRAEIQ
jgi:thioesterase domain-containing protein